MTWSHGFPHAFRATPWSQILEDLESHHAEYLRPIVESIIASPGDVLAGALWMDGLAVVPLPVRDPPMDVLIVSGTGNGIRIRHSSVTGRNDDITRPTDESVALFWRFAIEKFGMS